MWFQSSEVIPAEVQIKSINLKKIQTLVSKLVKDIAGDFITKFALASKNFTFFNLANFLSRWNFYWKSHSTVGFSTGRVIGVTDLAFFFAVIYDFCCKATWVSI